MWVHVGVKLHEGLGLVVGEPDGGDGLELDAGDGEVRHAVTRQVQHRQLRQVANLVRQPAATDMLVWEPK